MNNKRSILELVETSIVATCTFDRQHRWFGGFDGGVAATGALLAFHQLIVKRTAVVKVRDHGESKDFKTKNVA